MWYSETSNRRTLFVTRYVRSGTHDLLLILLGILLYAYPSELFAELPCVSDADQTLEQDFFPDLRGICRHIW